MLEGDRIVWPQADCLAGVTMRLLSESYGGQVSTAPLTLDQVSDADAVFATNAATGLRPISAIDGIRWPAEHPALNVLRRTYAGIPADRC